MEDIQNNTPVQEQQPSAIPAAEPSIPPEIPRTGCTGNCMNCPPYQRTYCAAQISFNTQNLVANLAESVATLYDSVARLSDNIAAIKEQEASVPKVMEAPSPSKTVQTKKARKPAK